MISPARVLVIDDDPALLSSVVAALGAEGFAVKGLPDGSELPEALRAFVPDLVVLDWMLPGASGIRLAATVRTSSDAAVVMLTARDELDDRLRGFAEGVDDYVVKPFSVAELLARIGAVLRRRGRIPAVIEVADLVFAVDSVPAIFAITTDPYIVYTSNIFAILGLRALYFALAAMVHRFAYLKYALSLVLIFIGAKIFWNQLFGKLDPSISLGVTFALLAGGVVVSLLRTRSAAPQLQDDAR